MTRTKAIYLPIYISFSSLFSEIHKHLNARNSIGKFGSILLASGLDIQKDIYYNLLEFLKKSAYFSIALETFAYLTAIYSDPGSKFLE